MKKIESVKSMQAFNGNYTVFRTTDGLRGIADRQGNVVYGPTANRQHIAYLWGTLFEILTIKPFQRQQIDVATGVIIDKCLQYPGLGTDIVYKENHLEGVCDVNYQTIIEPIYKSIYVIQGYYWAQSQDDKWGAIDAKGEVHLPFEYDDVVSASVNEKKDDIVVAKDGKYFRIDTNGNTISKQYDYLRPSTEAGYAIIRNEIGLAIIDKEEQIITQTHYQEDYRRNYYPDWLFYWCTAEHIAFAEEVEEGIYGIMTAQGKVVSEPKISHVMHSNLRDVIIIRDEESTLEGAIRSNGEIVLPVEYKTIWPRKMFNVMMVMQADKYGLIDGNGKTILPIEYDNISISNERGLAEIAVSKDGEAYFINEKGERVSVN
ncbi:MAG: WG repeat-containing protein [Paludibacteraceae bacterium]|nr:WG repeat-containing protein [Paludibacteraceae bacterium]